MFRQTREKESEKTDTSWDLYAAALSSACLLHCLLTPALAAAVPVFSHLSDSHLVHTILVLFATPITLWVVSGALKLEGGLVFGGIASVGLALMLAAVFVPQWEKHEVPLTVIGASLLGSAHLWRWNRHRVRHVSRCG